VDICDGSLTIRHAFINFVLYFTWLNQIVQCRLDIYFLAI
jgi:hypothetical protein